MKYDHDFIVIGAGPGGLTAAIGLGSTGKDVVLIEKGEIGGDCTNHGCVPSKALLHAAKSDQYTSVAQAMDYVRTQRQHIRDEETPDVLAEYGVKTQFGLASFVDTHTVRITADDETTSTVTASQIIIATGAKARTIAIDGVASDDLLTNESLFEIEEDIQDLAIVGGGVIACEMAEAFVRLGTTVTILEKHHNVIHREDKQVSELMNQHLTSLGVTIITQDEVDHGEYQYGKKTITTKSGKSYVYDKILLTIGRVPLIDALDLDQAGISYSKKGIQTDDYARTSVSHIYAIGDCVASNPKFTHRSNNQGRILVQNLLTAPYLLRHRRNTKQGHPLPWTIYTTQEISRVGLASSQAHEQYGDAVVTRNFGFGKNDRSKLEQTADGLLQLTFKRLSLQLVGVTIVSPHSGEMLPQFTIAIKHRIGLLGLSKVIFQYPTRSDIIKLAIDDYMLHLSKHWKDELRWIGKNILNGKVFKAI